MHHTLSYVRVSSLFQGQLSAVKCDCNTGVFWIAKGQNRDEVIAPHLAPDDTYEFVEEDRTMIKVNPTPTQANLKFELFPQAQPPGTYVKVTHIPSGMKWTFTPQSDESPLSLRERALTEVTAALIKFKFKVMPDPDPSIEPTVEPERVTWPPVEPADPRSSRPPRKPGKTSTIGDLQLTETYTNTGSWIMTAFHVPTGTSMSVRAKENESPRMAKVRAVRMMAAALRSASLGAMG